MPAEVRIDASRLERLLRGPGSPGVRLLRRRAARVAARAQQLAPGSMGQYISTRVEGSGRGLTAVVTCSHPATRYYVFGTRKHIIRPRRAKALRFTVEGRLTFAKVVHHPGQPARNFLAQSLREAL